MSLMLQRGPMLRPHGPPPLPLTPADLFADSEQGVWYDPSDLTTLFTDTEGTTPAGVNDTVALMLDKSGNGNHATQATAAKRPTLMQDGGGRYYLSFDGTDDGMVTLPIAPGTDKAQIFTGVDQVFGAGTGIIVEWSPIFSASANNGSFAISRAQTKISFNIRANTNAGWEPAFSQDGAETLSLQIDVFGATLSEELIPRRNGVIVQNNQSGSATGTGTLAERSLYIGARNQSQYYFNGKIYGIAIRFGQNLTTAEIGELESWMADKTGVTL